MSNFNADFGMDHQQKRLIIKQQEEIFKLTQQLKAAEGKQKLAESTVERMMDVAFADKPVAFRLDRVKQILRETKGRNGGGGYDLFA